MLVFWTPFYFQTLLTNDNFMRQNDEERLFINIFQRQTVFQSIFVHHFQTVARRQQQHTKLLQTQKSLTNISSSSASGSGVSGISSGGSSSPCIILMLLQHSYTHSQTRRRSCLAEGAILSSFILLLFLPTAQGGRHILHIKWSFKCSNLFFSFESFLLSLSFSHQLTLFPHA